MRFWRRRSSGLVLPRHRGTTANLASLYPWHTGPGPTTRGPYLGVNVTGGGTGWFYDPFELYGGALTDSNVLIAGRPGKGKSTAVKTFLYREIGVYGQRRFIAINDPKGEYGALGERLGMPIIKLHPGGRHRLNPLDPAPGDKDDAGLLGRQRLVTGMLAVVLERRLEPAEESLVAQSIGHLAESGERFDLADLARIIGDPPGELLANADIGRLSEIELRTAVMPIRFALGKLLDRTLRGMFDGPTNVSVDWDTGPGVVHRPVSRVPGPRSPAARDDGGHVLAPVGDDGPRAGTARPADRRRGVGAAGERVDRSPPAGSPQTVSALGDLQRPRLPSALRPSSAVRGRQRCPQACCGPAR